MLNCNELLFGCAIVRIVCAFSADGFTALFHILMYFNFFISYYYFADQNINTWDYAARFLKYRFHCANRECNGYFHDAYSIIIFQWWNKLRGKEKTEIKKKFSFIVFFCFTLFIFHKPWTYKILIGNRRQSHSVCIFES